MTVTTLITVGALGFALGLYVSSQIVQHIDTRTRHRKFLDNLNQFEKRDQHDN